jgi:hypothetical protein
MLKEQEGIAKLPAPEKSMILSQFVGVAERPELRRQGHTRESRLRRHEKVRGGPLQCKAGEQSEPGAGGAAKWLKSAVLLGRRVLQFPRKVKIFLVLFRESILRDGSRRRRSRI